MNSDLLAGLENANWPVLVVTAGCKIVAANSAASRTLGKNLKEETTLATVWSPLNPMTGTKFFDSWERSPSPTASLRFRCGETELPPFLVTVCILFRQGERY